MVGDAAAWSSDAVDLFDTTLRWTEQWFDPAVSAVWNPAGSFGEPAAARTFHLTPNTAWFAYGALRSDRPELREPARAALEWLLSAQYDAPGQPWDGSFPRFLEAPEPTAGARMWEDYDPNWRQFVGLTFAVLLEDLGGSLDPTLVGRIDEAIGRCVSGEPDGRIAPSYTNPALMRAWLDGWFGRRHGDAALVGRGGQLGGEVVDLFDQFGAFDEFNSPTYYGIDLLALRLWQVFPPTAWFAAQGARLEREVWASAAAFFNPGLGTFAGPFTRAYTPDARRAVTVMALWIWADSGRARAPLPALDASSVDHGHDLMAGPLIARLSVGSAGRAGGAGGGGGQPRFVPPVGVERRVAVALAGDRRIETEIRPGWSLGVESSPMDWGGWDQFMPVVFQWREGVAGNGFDDVGVCWLGRPGVVVGELVGGADPVVELELATGGTIELLTYSDVVVVGSASVALGRRARLVVTAVGAVGADSVEVDVAVDADADVDGGADSSRRRPRRIVVSVAAGAAARVRLAFAVDAVEG